MATKNKLTFGIVAIYSGATMILSLSVIYLLNILNNEDKTIVQFNIGIGAIILIAFFTGSILFREKIIASIVNIYIAILLTIMVSIGYLTLSYLLIKISTEIIPESFYTILIFLLLSTLIVFPINIYLRQKNIGSQKYHKIINFLLFYSSTVLVTIAFVAPEFQDIIGFMVLILAVPILSNNFYETFYSNGTK
ncbi:hypothetical protein [Anaerobacillus sp. 1_MG-2023]|uniref:hypothetical protein n=1 Tax=Anaerobacillus sp. 1_MG-2023 TaxID=3062655 RepID=UPI0026E2FD0D|nr:hypothetical protein [Anaerobacillus sp. 1_MG-2023]MDO6657511.1 hypothetical protein [Anaerobacillus sp. 1_MG-2023]